MIRPTFPGWDQDTEWVECVWCGAKALRVDLIATSLTAEPTADEVITGASSGHTGKFLDTSWVQLGGSGDLGTAWGWMTLYDVTGHNYLTGLWGSAGETITGASAFVGVLKEADNGDPQAYIKMDGVTLHRIDDCTKRDGKWYCHKHYYWYFHGKDRDESNRDARIDERDRGQEWS